MLKRIFPSAKQAPSQVNPGQEIPEAHGGGWIQRQDAKAQSRQPQNEFTTEARRAQRFGLAFPAHCFTSAPLRPGVLALNLSPAQGDKVPRAAVEEGSSLRRGEFWADLCP